MEVNIVSMLLQDFCKSILTHRNVIFEFDDVFKLIAKYEIEEVEENLSYHINFYVRCYLGKFKYEILVEKKLDCYRLYNLSCFDRLWSKRSIIIIADLLKFLTRRKVELYNKDKIAYISLCCDFIKYRGISFSEEHSVHDLSDDNLLFLVSELDMNNLSYFNVFNNDFSVNHVCIADNKTNEVLAFEDCPKIVTEKICNYLSKLKGKVYSLSKKPYRK